jgi:ketosteroid isomerase-like protein
MEFVHPESRWFFPGDPAILPWAGWFRGAGMMRFFTRIAETIEYEHYTVDRMHAAGEHVTVLSHEACIVKKNRRKFSNQLVAVAHVVGGKIWEFLEYSDTAAMHAAFEGLPRVIRPDPVPDEEN